MGEREGAIVEAEAEKADVWRFLEERRAWVKAIGAAGIVAAGSVIAFGLVRRRLRERAKGKTAKVLDSLADLEQRGGPIIRLKGPEELADAVPVEEVVETAGSLAEAIKGKKLDMIFREKDGIPGEIRLSDLLRLIRDVCRINAGQGTESFNSELPIRTQEGTEV